MEVSKTLFHMLKLSPCSKQDPGKEMDYLAYVHYQSSQIWPQTVSSSNITDSIKLPENTQTLTTMTKYLLRKQNNGNMNFASQFEGCKSTVSRCLYFKQNTFGVDSSSRHSLSHRHKVKPVSDHL